MKRSEPDNIEHIINNFIQQFEQKVPTKEEDRSDFCYNLSNTCKTLAMEMSNDLAIVLVKRGLMEMIYKLLLKDDIKLDLHADLYFLIHAMYQDNNKTIEKQSKLLTLMMNQMSHMIDIKESMKEDVHLLENIINVLIDFCEYSPEYLANITTSPLLIHLINLLNPTEEPYNIPINVSRLLVVLTDDNQLCVELLTQKIPQYYDILTKLCDSKLPDSMKICYATILHNIHPVIHKTLPIILPIILRTIDCSIIEQYETIKTQLETHSIQTKQNNKENEEDELNIDIFVKTSNELKTITTKIKAMKMGIELLTNITTFDDEPNPVIKKNIEESKIPEILVKIIQHPINKTEPLIVSIIETTFSALNNVLLILDNSYQIEINGTHSTMAQILFPLLSQYIKKNSLANLNTIERALLDGSLMCYHRLLLKGNIETEKSEYTIMWELTRKYQQYTPLQCQSELPTIINLCYILSIIGKEEKAPLRSIALFVKNMLSIKLEETTEILYDAVLNIVLDLFAEENTNEILKTTGLYKTIKEHYKSFISYTLEHIREDDTSLEDVINNLERYIDYKTKQGL
ncbi:hypothetical protein ENUP19_0251G0006 [Entamoeba nuttalli]|uniref:Uncharacterized protein n=2 Tax=Entamoeba nuttalli TaxID=412467 RepID=K2GXM8_ENTNP|nr:hypothetical protein ENU1_104870 [Entamoeba nuttalli P19]EKE40028.1 hypothetical protein ENU1_104870 [Entamoeba nuttalli P19]|eukprot:XP_008857640.1 hypothetical protein ENU1_104870 [Entamoeba nuttalli P19]